jgi:hypothetical protein
MNTAFEDRRGRSKMRRAKARDREFESSRARHFITVCLPQSRLSSGFFLAPNRSHQRPLCPSQLLSRCMSSVTWL